MLVARVLTLLKLYDMIAYTQPPVAQLVRASSLYLEGPWFESKRVDQAILNASSYRREGSVQRGQDVS